MLQYWAPHDSLASMIDQGGDIALSFYGTLPDNSSTEDETKSPATYASDALGTGRLPGQCASMHPKPTLQGSMHP